MIGKLLLTKAVIENYKNTVIGKLQNSVVHFVSLNILELKDWLGIFAVMLVKVHLLDCVC